MFKHSTLAAILMAAAVFATGLVQAGQKQDGFVVGFANGYIGNTWRSQFVENFEKAAQAHKDKGTLKDFQVANTNADVTEQINQLNAMLNSGVDALMICAVSPTSLKPIVDQAKRKGVLVVITNDPAAYPGTYAVVGDNASWMKVQALWFAEKLNGKGNVVEITGVPGNAADTIRQQTTRPIFEKYPDLKILASAPGKWSQTEAQSVMTTFLSTYPQIDGVYIQDVMAEGVMKAYENAGKTPPIMTGDSLHSFFKRWKATPGMDSIGVPYAPGVSVTALEITIKLLQGGKLKQELLKGNPFDENLMNTIYVDPPYVVTLEGDQNAPWMQGYVNTKAISLDEALKILDGQPDTASLDGWMTGAQVEAYFE